MPLDDLLKEDCLGARDVLNLAVHRIGQEADKITRVPRLQGNADFAVGPEAANPGAMACARIDDNEGTLALVDDYLGRGNDAGQNVVERAREVAPVAINSAS